jgi:hypothetical protein
LRLDSIFAAAQLGKGSTAFGEHMRDVLGGGPIKLNYMLKVIRIFATEFAS